MLLTLSVRLAIAHCFRDLANLMHRSAVIPTLPSRMTVITIRARLYVSARLARLCGNGPPLEGRPERSLASHDRVA